MATHGNNGIALPYEACKIASMCELFTCQFHYLPNKPPNTAHSETSNLVLRTL